MTLHTTETRSFGELGTQDRRGGGTEGWIRFCLFLHVRPWSVFFLPQTFSDVWTGRRGSAPTVAAELRIYCILAPSWADRWKPSRFALRGVINVRVSCHRRLFSPLRQKEGPQIYGQARVNFTTTGEGRHVRFLHTSPPSV